MNVIGSKFFTSEYIKYSTEDTLIQEFIHKDKTLRYHGGAGSLENNTPEKIIEPLEGERINKRTQGNGWVVSLADNKKPTKEQLRELNKESKFLNAVIEEKDLSEHRLRIGDKLELHDNFDMFIGKSDFFKGEYLSLVFKDTTHIDGKVYANFYGNVKMSMFLSDNEINVKKGNNPIQNIKADNLGLKASGTISLSYCINDKKITKSEFKIIGKGSYSQNFMGIKIPINYDIDMNMKSTEKLIRSSASRNPILSTSSKDEHVIKKINQLLKLDLAMANFLLLTIKKKKKKNLEMSCFLI